MAGSKRKRQGHSMAPVKTIDLSNQFDLLTDDESDPSLNIKTKKVSLPVRKVRIPPVVVKSDFRTVRSAIINDSTKLKYTFQLGRRGECRVQAETMEGFKHLQTMLSAKMFPFFTYDTKEERLFKVVLKGLPSGESTEDVQNEILKLLEPIAPVQVIKMKMKSRPRESRHGNFNEYFLVHFKSSELNNLKALEKASLMFHTRVQWEHFRRTGGIENLTQCRKCQSWGHGTRNCFMIQKCMNCGDSSHSKDNCPVKDHPTKFHCANCGKPHKANFWECETRKAILKSRANNQAKKQHKIPTTNSQRGINSRLIPEPRIHTSNGISYASVVSGVSPSLVQPTNCTYSAVDTGSTQKVDGQNDNTTRQNCSNGNSDDFDLGSITPLKMEFLQKSLMEMISQMMRTNSMFEAIQTGVKFANDIVMTLKFSNGY
jgi:hypothetical protein